MDAKELATDGRSEGNGLPELHRQPRWKRPALVAAAVGITVLLIVGTWVSATVFQSPAQREANASAPAPQPIFADVSRGVLSDETTYPGTIAYTSEATFVVTPAEASRSVVTGSAAAPGGTVRSGELFTEVNTRPVFFVASPFDFFRDVGFGDEGADVRVLQEALVERGYLDHVDESYGWQTARAVAKWYEDAGYEAPTRQRPTANTTVTEPSRVPSTPGNAQSPNPGSSGPSQPPADSVPSESDAASKPILDAFVPLPELLAVPSLPAIIISAPVIGAHVGGETPDLTLGSSALVVRATVPAAEAAGIDPGDLATVVSESGEVDAVVADVQHLASSDGAPSQSVLTVSTTSGAAVFSSERGAAVTVRVSNKIVAGESLIVPTAAVVGRGEGRGAVVKRQATGPLVEVPVTVVGSLRGMTAIEPDEVGELAEGDDVRVG